MNSHANILLADVIYNLDPNIPQKDQEQILEKAYSNSCFDAASLKAKNKDDLSPLQCAAKKRNIVAYTWLKLEAIQESWIFTSWQNYLDDREDFVFSLSFAIAFEDEGLENNPARLFWKQLSYDFDSMLYRYEKIYLMETAIKFSNLVYLKESLDKQLKNELMKAKQDDLLTCLLAKAISCNKKEIITYLLEIRHNLNLLTSDLPLKLYEQHGNITIETILHCLANPHVGFTDKTFIQIGIDHKDIKLFANIPQWQILLFNKEVLTSALQIKFNEFVFSMLDEVLPLQKPAALDRGALNYTHITIAIDTNNIEIIKYFHNKKIRIDPFTNLMIRDNIQKSYIKYNNQELVKLLLAMGAGSVAGLAKSGDLYEVEKQFDADTKLSLQGKALPLLQTNLISTSTSSDLRSHSLFSDVNEKKIDDVISDVSENQLRRRFNAIKLNN